MRRLTRSWSIFRKSLAVINQERKLLIFPLISAFAMFALILLIIAGIGTVAYLVIGSNPEMMQSMAAAAESAESAEEEPGMLVQIVSVAIFAVFYLVTMVLTNFCNVAFYSEIIRGIYGEPVRIGRGFGYALSRFKAIFLWSLLASTVGVILSMLSERAGLLGKLIIRLIGVVWAVASAFAIPALVCDPALDNPFQALKLSAVAIKKTWGESLAGFVGLWIITGMGTILLVLLTALLIAVNVMTGGVPAVMIGSAVVWFIGLVGLFILGYLVMVAEQVYRASLYLYAQYDVVGADFSEDEIAGAFKMKK